MNNKHKQPLWSVTLLTLLAGCDTSGSGLLGGIEGSGSRVTSAGAVSSLGSVLVNGVKYDLAGAAITVDGQLAREGDLAVGSIVIVEGTINADGATGHATRVTAGTAVAGPIGSLDAEHDRFTVLGQAVEVDLATTIENAIVGQPLGGLTVGSDIEVSGFADSSGTIHARRIAARGADRPLNVTGHVAQLDSSTHHFAVNGALVDYSSASLLGFGLRALDGAPVQVRGKTLSESGAIVADDVVYRDMRLPGVVGDAAAVQGWVTRFASATDFDLNGYRVVVTPSTTVVGNLGLDEFVEVRGQIIAEGAVQVSKLVNTGPYKFHITDVLYRPISGALVTLVGDSGRYEATTGADGVATFTAAPTGRVIVTISAPGYDTETFVSRQLGYYGPVYDLELDTVGEWGIGRAIVLGTRMVDKASDGSAMTFSVDVAVIDERSEAIQTLTSANFSFDGIDCGWGGPRDCASDSEGNATGHWYLYANNAPQAFGLQPPRARQPYRVRVLAVRNHRTEYWDAMVPALKSFFGRVGGNDSVSLSSVQVEDGRTTHTVLGPFTSNGSLYFDAINGLPRPAGGEPAMLDSLTESISSTAGPGAEPSVLVLAAPWISVAEVQTVTTLARELGVHISNVDRFSTYGVPEMTPRTGGFVVEVADPRQFAMVLGAADQLLAGTLPFYRMEFRITSEPGAFVSGGNAKVRLRVDVPTSLPTIGVYATMDVAIQ